jgi:hypothetical protein
VAGQWFSPCTQVSSTNKTDCHDPNKMNYDINIIHKLNAEAQKIDDILEPLPTGVCGRITSTNKDTLASYLKINFKINMKYLI